MDITDYTNYDGLGLAQLVQQQQVSPAEILATAIARIEQTNPQLNAVINTMYDHAKAQINAGLPNGIFQGVPMLLKDLLVSYANVPTRCGSRWLHDYTRAYDSELVTRYKNAGLLIVGKTNTPEWGLQASTEPQSEGATKNPWQAGYSAGGSSGGSAAAVASAMVPIAHGSDGGGSLRIPASCCGVFGLKPTRGRTPNGPDRGRMWQGLVVQHVLSRSVRDSAGMLDISAGNDVGTPSYLAAPEGSYLSALTQPLSNLKIALITEPFFPATVDKNCLAAVEHAATCCQDLGHHIEPVSLPIDHEQLLHHTGVLMASDSAALLQCYRQTVTSKPHGLELTTKALIKAGNRYSGAEMASTTYFFDQLTRQLGQLFSQYDVILTPTLAAPPPKLGSFLPSKFERVALFVMTNLLNGMGLKLALREGIKKSFAFSPFTALFNATGNPAMSVPLFWNQQGLPIGVQFIGRFADEKTLFQLAYQLEQAQPWGERITGKCAF